MPPHCGHLRLSLSHLISHHQSITAATNLLYHLIHSVWPPRVLVPDFVTFKFENGVKLTTFITAVFTHLQNHIKSFFFLHIQRAREVMPHLSWCKPLFQDVRVQFSEAAYYITSYLGTYIIITTENTAYLNVKLILKNITWDTQCILKNFKNVHFGELNSELPEERLTSAQM